MVQGRNPSDLTVIRFGIFAVDPARREIRRAGTLVAVEPKPFDLLLFLIDHRDRVVRRDELMEVLWPGVVVSEATLSSAVRRVRDVLGPERDRIRVIRKVGYRFLGEIALPQALDSAIGPRRVRQVTDTAAVTAGREPARAFFGRETELAQLDEVLAAGLAGRGCFISIAGDAGAGKSSTVTELARRAHERGVEVLVGRCFEGQDGQVFWPWVQVFRSFADNRPGSLLTDVLQGEAVDIALLTAAVTTTDPEGSSSDPEMQRARLLDSVITVLRRAAAASPLLLAFDDLHWADNATIMMLRAVVDAIDDVPVIVVGTYRDIEIAERHPLAALLSWLRQRHRHRKIALTGLDRSDVADLLHALAAAPVEAEVIDAVFTATEGNPLFIREYWHDLNESGAVVATESEWRWRNDRAELAIPATVSEIIRRRLQRLGSETNQLLAIGAVIGREFGYEVIGRISISRGERVVDALEEAATAGVIEEIANVPGSYRFTHALIRETLYEGMTGLRRAVLHRAVGEALEALSPGDASLQTIAVLAHHFLASVPAGGSERAIEYAARAAAEATRACAYDDAVRYLEHAVRLCDERPGAVDAPSPVRRCELQLELADAYRCAGDGTGMRSAYETGAAQARAIPEPRLLARAALGVTSRWVRQDVSAVQLLDEALAMLPAGDRALRALMTARLAKMLYLFSDTRSRREHLCAEAQTLARENGDAHVLADVFADSIEALFHDDSLAEQDAIADALHVAAQSAADPRLRLLAGAWHIVNAMRHGRLSQADQRLAEVARLAAELRQPRFVRQATLFEAALCLARGRLDAAEERSDKALALGIRIDETMARWQHWVQLYHLRREQGRLAAFLGGAELARTAPPDSPMAPFFERSVRWVTPHVFSELGHYDEARASFISLMARGLDDLPPENSRCTRISALFSLGDACATVGDERSAGLIYDALSPYRDQWQVIGWGVAVFGSAHYMLGTLRSVQRRWREADEHFEEALALHDRENAICAQARALYQYARAVRRRGRKVDVTRADRLAGRAFAIADEHGLRGIAARLRSLDSV